MEPFIPCFPSHIETGRIIRDITKYMNWEKYIEPMVEGGSHLSVMRPYGAIVNDTNEEVMNTLGVIKYNPTALVAYLAGAKNVNFEDTEFIDPIKRAAKYLHNYSNAHYSNFIFDEKVERQLFDYSVYLNSYEVQIVRMSMKNVLNYANKKDLVVINSTSLDKVYLKFLTASKAYFVWVYSEPNEELENLLPKFKVRYESDLGLSFLYTTR